MEKKKKKTKPYRFLRIIGKILGGLLLLIFLLLLFIRSPWGQNIIKNKVIASLSEKTGTAIEVERLFITFSGNIFLEGLYMEDEKGDTLLYSRSFEADVPFLPILRGGDIVVNSISSSGLRANIIRKDSLQGFNYEFLMEAFASTDTTAVSETEKSVDSTAAKQNFVINEVQIDDLKLGFLDGLSGIDSRFLVGELKLEIEFFDLEQMDFHVSEAALRDSEIHYVQTKIPPPSENEEAVPMPDLIVDELQLENVLAYYESIPGGILADLQLAEASLELPKGELSHNIIEVKHFQLNNSDILLQTGPSEDAMASTQIDSLIVPPEAVFWDIRVDEISLKENNISYQALTEENISPEASFDAENTGKQEFTWPSLKLEVNSVSLEDNAVSYLVNGAEPTEGVFNPQAVAITGFDLSLEDVFLRNESAGATLNNLSFQEASGINLRELALSARLDNTALDIEGLVLNINENNLEGNLHLGYTSLQDLMDSPENSVLSLNIPEFRLISQDIFLFQPELRSNEYVRGFARKNLSGRLVAEGTLANIQLSTANIHWGASTDLWARGRLRNLTNPDKLGFQLPDIKFSSTREDLGSFIEEDSLGVQFPEELHLNASLSGNLEDMEAVLALETTEGNINLEGAFSTANELSFNGALEVQELQLGYLLANEQLGPLNLTLIASGEGESMNNLDASLQSTITSMEFNNYAIQDLHINGELTEGRGPISMQYTDENLDFEMANFVILDTLASQVNTSLDVYGANLRALGLSSKDIRIGFELDGSFRGDATAYDVNAEIEDGVTVYGNKSYLLGDFLVSARVRPDSTAFDILNQIVEMSLRSNTDPASFAGALQRHYRSYFSESVETDTLENPVNLQLNGTIRENDILDEVFLSALDDMDTLQLMVDFREQERILNAEVSLPFASYMGSEIDSLSLYLNSNRQDFDFGLNFNGLNTGPIAIQRTSLEGSIDQKVLHLNFLSYDAEEELISIRSEITRRNDTIRFTLDPSAVVFDRQVWEVPETNKILIAPNFLAFQDFLLTHGNQRLEVTDDWEEVEKEHVGILFENFRLQSLVSYLNPQEPLASGSLNGNFTVEEPFGTTGLLANLNINDLHVFQVPLGVLTMDAEAINYEDYNFDLAIKEGNVDLDLTGGFQVAEGGAQWDTHLDLNRVNMELLEGFSFGAITNSEGYITGNADLSGTLADPQYDGQLVFNDAGFNVSAINADFMLRNETLSLDTLGLYFDDFQIQDANSNLFSIDGEVLTESFLNPSFNLNLTADNFTLLNSTREDNDLVYGKAVIDLDATLEGNLNAPILDLEVEFGSETNLTYIIPESEIGIEERDGVVRFVNRENPDDILTATEEESFTFSGMEIDSRIILDEEAVFNVIINEQTGDNLRILGEGDLLFQIYANGRTTLTGLYELSGGHYEMNLYGIVNRRFEIMDGSRISWAGDPLGAELDLRASYSVETSASSLMASQVTGADPSVQQRFRQELPFLVYLDINGELMQPQLEFGLDMPEDDQGAVGGQVYGRLQQVNQQEEELNKQVFSLLVLNRFYPTTGSDGSGGGTLDFARDNLNDALSDQLNMFSSNLLGDTGFQLDFGLDTYTDYQGESPQERTQLDISAEKAFMDDRIVARVGSEVDIQGSAAPGEETPLIGNVSLEYLITENGIWRIRGFRSDRFENVIEGQVIVSGLALIFQREFNEFRQLFDKLREEEEE